MRLFLFISIVVSTLTFAVTVPSAYNQENLRNDPTNSPLLNGLLKHSFDQNGQEYAQIPFITPENKQLDSDDPNTNYVQFIKIISYSGKGPDSAKDGPDSLYVTPKLMNLISSSPNQFFNDAQIYETKILQSAMTHDNELKSSTNNAIDAVGFYVYGVDGNIVGKLEPSGKSFNTNSNSEINNSNNGNLINDEHKLIKRDLATAEMIKSEDPSNPDTLTGGSPFAGTIKNIIS